MNIQKIKSYLIDHEGFKILIDNTTTIMLKNSEIDLLCVLNIKSGFVQLMNCLLYSGFYINVSNALEEIKTVINQRRSNIKLANDNGFNSALVIKVDEKVDEKFDLKNLTQDVYLYFAENQKIRSKIKLKNLSELYLLNDTLFLEESKCDQNSLSAYIEKVKKVKQEIDKLHDQLIANDFTYDEASKKFTKEGSSEEISYIIKEQGYNDEHSIIKVMKGPGEIKEFDFTDNDIFNNVTAFIEPNSSKNPAVHNTPVIKEPVPLILDNSKLALKESMNKIVEDHKQYIEENQFKNFTLETLEETGRLSITFNNIKYSDQKNQIYSKESFFQYDQAGLSQLQQFIQDNKEILEAQKSAQAQLQENFTDLEIKETGNLKNELMDLRFELNIIKLDKIDSTKPYKFYEQYIVMQDNKKHKIKITSSTNDNQYQLNNFIKLESAKKNDVNLKTEKQEKEGLKECTIKTNAEPVLGGGSGKIPEIKSKPNNAKKSNVKSWAVPLGCAALTIIALMTIFFVASNLMLALGVPIGVLGAVLTVASAIFLRDKTQVDLSGPTVPKLSS